MADPAPASDVTPPPAAQPKPTTPKTRLREVAHVAPGMVPRESDYVTIEPVSTITTPEASPAPVKVEVKHMAIEEPEPVKPASERPAPAKPAPERPFDRAETPEPVLVRPDVLPPEDADWTEGKTRP
ncbi:hypothetical protein ACFSYD_00075 [Paracoccus aerius]